MQTLTEQILNGSYKTNLENGVPADWSNGQIN